MRLIGTIIVAAAFAFAGMTSVSADAQVESVDIVDSEHAALDAFNKTRPDLLYLGASLQNYINEQQPALMK